MSIFDPPQNGFSHFGDFDDFAKLCKFAHFAHLCILHIASWHVVKMSCWRSRPPSCDDNTWCFSKSLDEVWGLDVPSSPHTSSKFLDNDVMITSMTRFRFERQWRFDLAIFRWSITYKNKKIVFYFLCFSTMSFDLKFLPIIRQFWKSIMQHGPGCQSYTSRELPNSRRVSILGFLGKCHICDIPQFGQIWGGGGILNNT